MERRWLATSPLTSPGAKLARLPHTFANQSWENSCFFCQIVLRCIRLYFRYCNVLNLCAVERRGILYGVLFGIGSCKHLEQKVWIAQKHRAGEIIIFVSLKQNSANGLSKYESVNHVTIKSLRP